MDGEDGAGGTSDLWGRPDALGPAPDLWARRALDAADLSDPQDLASSVEQQVARRPPSAVDRLRRALGTVERALREAAAFTDDLIEGSEPDDPLRADLAEVAELLEGEAAAALLQARAHLRRSRTGSVVALVRRAAAAAREALLVVEDGLEVYDVPAGLEDLRDALTEDVHALRRIRSRLRSGPSRELT